MKEVAALKAYLALGVALIAVCGYSAAPAADVSYEVFSTPRQLRIEIPPEGAAVLNEYRQVWRQKRPERIDVHATIVEGTNRFTNVAVHLKGSFSFQPLDSKPSLTLNFDKFAPGQKFHGLTKLHLNNSVQDPSYLCEQLSREVFNSLGVPAPRAGHAIVSLNGRPLGLFVLIEGANKQFVKRHFKSTAGNLYDGGSGGEITSALETDSGDNPEDRSDLKRLAQATRETDLVKRLASLEDLLDVERFINFAATEAFMVHWDGYCLNGNNYRLFHDVSREKMVFIPHGLDQLFGVSSSLSSSITPPFKGLVAKALFSIPEARQRYLDRVAKLSANELSVEASHARLDRLAAQLRPALANDPQMAAGFEPALANLKSRIVQRSASVAQQLKSPKRPVQFVGSNPMGLSGWRFKSGLTQNASGSRNGDILWVTSRGTESSGAWRTTLLLGAGHYEFTGRAQTVGVAPAGAKSTNGVILRVSGERSTKGITISDDWKDLIYAFDVRGIEDVELVCEFRGARGSGHFDATSLRLARKGPPITSSSGVPAINNQSPDPDAEN